MQSLWFISEDIYIITSNIPNNKDKIYHYKHNHHNNLKFEKAFYLTDNDCQINNILENNGHNNLKFEKAFYLTDNDCQISNILENNGESDELQIIDYSYQVQQSSNNLKNLI